MNSYLETMRNITLLEETVTIKSTLKPENEAAMDALAKAVVEKAMS